MDGGAAALQEAAKPDRSLAPSGARSPNRGAFLSDCCRSVRIRWWRFPRPHRRQAPPILRQTWYSSIDDSLRCFEVRTSAKPSSQYAGNSLSDESHQASVTFSPNPSDPVISTSKFKKFLARKLIFEQPPANLILLFANTMKHIIALIYAMLLLLVACKQDSGQRMPKVGGIDAEIAGSYPVVVTRNFPDGTSKGMVRMSPDLHLGQNAFAAEASDSWLNTLEKLEPGEPKNTLPVLFAKFSVFADGKTRLVVGQLQCSLNGDGSFSPSSTFSCLLYTLDISNSTNPVILWKGKSTLGTLQHSRIIRIVPDNSAANEASVIHEDYLGESSVLRTVFVFKPSEGLTVSMERRPSKAEKPKSEQGATSNGG